MGMQATLDRYTADRTEQVAFVEQLCGAAEADSRDLVPAEQESIDRARARVVELDEQIRGISQFLATQASGDAAARAARDGGHPRDTPPGILVDGHRTLGELFVDSEEYRAYRGRGQSGTVAARMPLNARATITTGTSPGSVFVQPDRSFNPAIPAYQTPLLDLINKIQVDSGSVEYVTYPAAAPLAAVVPEGTAKPEATLTATKVTSALDTIAHYEAITRQAYQDSQQLVDWINGNLIRGVGDKLEALAAASLTGATLPTNIGAAGSSLLESIRGGVAKVQMAGFRPNAVVLNPMDYAELDIAVLGKTLLGPVIGSQFWGLTPIPVGAVPAGQAYVGDYTSGMTFFYRGETEVYMTDSHSDFFLKNTLVILAERRALSAVTRAEALVKCTVAP